MNLQTIVNAEPLEHKISYRHKILFTGSCFASEIGTLMKKMRYRAEVNPFGLMYNPASVALTLQRLENGTLFTEEDLFCQDGIFKSIFLSSEYAAHSAGEFLRTNNERLSVASSHFRESGWIIVTFGTSWIFTVKDSGNVAANCHKLPSSDFFRSRLTIDQIFDIISPFLERSKDKKWLFTVSPVRHWKDGAHQNQLSKATLLLAVERLVEKHPNAFYFPAYEIMMDQLRDYRFYAEDMIHPSGSAIGYIWERFRELCLEPSEEPLMKIVNKLNSMEDHRPLFPFSKEYKRFENEKESLKTKVEAELRKLFNNYNL